MTYDEALDEAICFGWIDGRLGRRDAATFRRRFTPRTARSPWSRRNAAIADRLTPTGRMHRTGADEVRRAKEDGRWEAAYAGQADIEVPQDLADALRADPRAEATFGTLTRANRYAVLYRIGNARKPETRARRIAQFVDMLARGETIHPRPPDHPGTRVTARRASEVHTWPAGPTSARPRSLGGAGGDRTHDQGIMSPVL